MIPVIVGNPPYSAGKHSANESDAVLRKRREGYVTTPVEIIDFIAKSVEWQLSEQFGRQYHSPDVLIIDPFAGKGEFFCRMVETGMLQPEKYEYNLRAYEIDPGRHSEMETNFARAGLDVDCRWDAFQSDLDEVLM